MAEKLYIHIRSWDRFQHYKKRDAPWIKDYTAQLNNQDWKCLTLRQRGLLQGLRLLYAAGGRQGLGSSPAQVGMMLGDPSVRARDFEALNDAGFILYSDSKVLAKRSQDATPEGETEREGEGETEKNQDQEPNPTPPITSYLPPELRPQPKNGSGGGTEKGLEPIAQTAADLLTQLRGAA